jgi:hypothetical protein
LSRSNGRSLVPAPSGERTLFAPSTGPSGWEDDRLVTWRDLHKVAQMIIREALSAINQCLDDSEAKLRGEHTEELRGVKSLVTSGATSAPEVARATAALITAQVGSDVKTLAETLGAQCKALSKEMESQRVRHVTRLNDLKLKHSQDLAAVRQAHQDARNEFEWKFREQAERHDKAIASLLDILKSLPTPNVSVQVPQQAPPSIVVNTPDQSRTTRAKRILYDQATGRPAMILEQLVDVEPDEEPGRIGGKREEDDEVRESDELLHPPHTPTRRSAPAE